MKQLLLFCLIIFYPVVVVGDDWPQWHGPNRNAISNEKGLLQQWPEGGPPLAWRVEGLGGGDSAPAIVGGVLYGMSNRDGKEIVWARSASDGKELWVSPIGDAVSQRVPQSKEGPACTPTVEGESLFIVGMGGTVACLNTKDGKIVWQRSFTEDFGGATPMWSFRESPLVDDNKVICTPGSSEAMLVALDKRTGKTIWKSGEPVASTQPAQSQSRTQNSSRGRTSSRQESSPSTPQISGTKDPSLFLSEHWGMTAFSHKVPNGKYLAKLYFAETYSGIRREGQRVFNLNVEGTEFKDFDIWKKAGGPMKAYIESVPVEIKDGALDITFTRKSENPAIKAIEILPQDQDSKIKPVRIKAGERSAFKDAKGQVWLADQGFAGGSTSPGIFNTGGSRSGRPSGFGNRGGGRARPGAGYSSVIAIDFEGQRQYVQLTAKNLLGVSASTGKVLWEYAKPANAMGINCSTPIYEDGIVFAASAYGNGGGAVKLKKNTDGSISADEVYFTSRMQNHHGGMVVIDGCLYGANGGNGGGYLSCLDFQTGEVLWKDRKGPKGSLMFADGRIYLRGERRELLLIEPSKEGLIERGRFEQPDRSSSMAWAHPVVANGKLYIRDQGLLLCYDVRAK